MHGIKCPPTPHHPLPIPIAPGIRSATAYALFQIHEIIIYYLFAHHITALGVRIISTASFAIQHYMHMSPPKAGTDACL